MPDAAVVLQEAFVYRRGQVRVPVVPEPSQESGAFRLGSIFEFCHFFERRNQADVLIQYPLAGREFFHVVLKELHCHVGLSLLHGRLRDDRHQFNGIGVLLDETQQFRHDFLVVFDHQIRDAQPAAKAGIAGSQRHISGVPDNGLFVVLPEIGVPVAHQAKGVRIVRVELQYTVDRAAHVVFIHQVSQPGDLISGVHVPVVPGKGLLEIVDGQVAFLRNLRVDQTHTVIGPGASL